MTSSQYCASYKKPTRRRKKSQVKLRFHHQALPQEYLDHYEATQNQLVAEDSSYDSLREKNKCYEDVNHLQEQKINDSMQLWLKKVTELHDDKMTHEQTSYNPEGSGNAVVIKKTNRIISYNDLPYMGEITLENSKPRRGRKPKKADICHLIYKNYGTVFPDKPQGTPANIKKTTIQNKLINGLIETRLTQHGNDNSSGTNKKLEKKNQSISEEPLNLCIRDIFDENSQQNPRDELLPLLSSNDLSLMPNLKMTVPDFRTALLETKISDETVDISDILNSNWSSSNAISSPMSIYLHKMAESASISSNDTLTTSEKAEKTTSKNKLVPKKISSDKTATVTAALKRKRSAIFIPPVPEESSTNHATEVSICKFKFTGGIKPSLQEKKMLSVDAGGNFRYYSGTGDKSVRGYEFFPRESLQQSSLLAYSNAGAFLNTPSKRIQTDIHTPKHGTSNELHEMSVERSATSITDQQSVLRQSIICHSDLGKKQLISAVNNKHRKRKSKRSMQRENLEKTFKEKGFLIQTQQLQSAEGATYCKFRQLRKFTRYLFRSWKDYLPGELQHSGAAVPIDSAAIDNNVLKYL